MEDLKKEIRKLIKENKDLKEQIKIYKDIIKEMEMLLNG